MAMEALNRKTLLTMAAAAAFCVANIYYNQPLLAQIREDLNLGSTQIGLIPTLTQAGYALGMLFIVPVGDKVERKKLILFFTLFSAVISALMASTFSFAGLVMASFLLGLSSITPQLLVPFAAKLALPQERGKVIGTMVSGLLLGILLARTFSGFMGTAFGWRAVFWIASGLMLVVSASLSLTLPKSPPSFTGSYAKLLQSVYVLVKTQPILREACLFGAMLFGAFSAFWANLIYLMEGPTFNLGARAVGLFGLLGAVAAAAVPMIGSFVDKKSPRTTTGVMIAVTMASFILFLFSAESLIGLGMGVIFMDIGVQAGHVSNQSRIFALQADAQSRIQTAYMFTYFLGGAVGSFIGTWSWSHHGWSGVCLAAIGLLSVSMLRYLIAAPPVPHQ